MNARSVVAAALAAVILSGLAGTVHAAEGVCAWGGTPAAPTGVFHFDVGLTNVHPAAAPIHLTAVGDLAGAGAGCTGTMSLDGYILPGGLCRAFVLWGSVSGVPDIAWFFEASGAAGVGVLYRPDGSVGGVYSPSVIHSQTVDLVMQCRTEEGITDGNFSGIVALAPSA